MYHKLYVLGPGVLSETDVSPNQPNIINLIREILTHNLSNTLK